MTDTPANEDLRQAALDYHQLDPPGKIKVVPTKALVTQRDLSLAYSPGVAAANHRPRPVRNFTSSAADLPRNS